MAGAAVAAAVVATAATAGLIRPGAADGTPLAQPAAIVTVTGQAPAHPTENEDDVRYGAAGLAADKMAVLDSRQTGTHQARVDNTKYMSTYEPDQAEGRLVCVFGQNTIGLVKVTKVSEGDSNYITMDLTVWQR
ncbi:hypothetical protein [Nonomuraea sp. NPDC048901]|uniref:hypothetical protein n=1 Tax=Nonomuraea sp. NPDC048901 TaxID=3155627 RepID=UPI003411B6F8